MARIIFGVNGDGFGHATRSRAIAQHLEKKHTLKFFAGGKAYPYLKKYFSDVKQIPALHCVYEHNEVNLIKTLMQNTLYVFDNLHNIPGIITDIKKFNPLLIISDFEPVTLYTSFLMRIPCITIDNQHIITQTTPKIPIKNIFDYLNLRAVTRFMGFKASYYCIPSFFYPKIRNSKKTYLIPPVVREEIQKLKPKNKNHIFIYQTSDTYVKLLPLLKQLHETFIIYGFEKENREKNLIFRKFNEQIFFKDLAESKAVITNGGFSLISEALYLGKPILSVPIQKTFEQILNALYIQELRYGEYYSYLTIPRITHFLAHIKEYQKNILTMHKKNPKKGLGEIEHLIENMCNLRK
jgi:uncharacterized protein (TIGR00661 family)